MYRNIAFTCKEWKPNSLGRLLRYKLVCEQNVFCYPYVRSYVKAYYQKSLAFALKVL